MAETRKDEFDGRPDLVKKRAHTILWQRIAIAALMLYLLFSTTALLVNAYQGAQTRAVLLDCTQPDGDCNRESRQQTANFIKQLVDSNHFGDLATQEIVRDSAICSSKPENAGNAVRINKCINTRLNADKKG